MILHDNDVDLAVLDPDWTLLLDGLRANLPAKYSLKGEAEWVGGGQALGGVLAVPPTHRATPRTHPIPH